MVAFILWDATDRNPYTDDYKCGDYAEDVHNIAESMGIRAGWVGIYFVNEDAGHACNVFETTDRGLVYIDCTGENPEELPTSIAAPDVASVPKNESWDKVAYIQIGKEYGVIPLDKASGVSYGFYEQYKQDWEEYKRLLDEYNDEVNRYNEEIEGKVYYEGSTELARIKDWEAELKAMKAVLDEMAARLGNYWFDTLGIVEKVDLHW